MWLQKIKILNLEIDNISMNELLEDLSQGVVVTPNVDHAVRIQNDYEFYKVFKDADYVICDSKLLQFSSYLLGSPIKEKISGSDFFPAFYQYHAQNEDIKIFLLGAAEGIAGKAANIINEKVGRQIVVNAYSPSYGFEKDEIECLMLVEMIKESDANVLAVGVGSPKGEKWIMNYKSLLPNINIFMGIGATIDFEAGNVKRAPTWISKIGMEWLYRLYHEPKRLWKRYLVDDMPFFWLLLKSRLGLYKNPWIFKSKDEK